MGKEGQDLYGPNAFISCLRRSRKLDNQLYAIPEINLGLEDKPDYHAKI
jgi:hypothetical protein